MPRGDGTGPMGFGPMTGRAAGYCAGYGVPGFMNPIPRAGFGMGAMPYAGHGAPMGSPYAMPFASGYPAGAWEWGAEAALAAAAVSGSRGSVKDQAKSYLKEV